MCGTAGILHADPEHHVRELDLTALRDGLRHRGPKLGFGVPVGEWMRRGGPMEMLIERVLEDQRTSQRHWFDVDYPRRLFGEHRSGIRDRTEILWGLLNLELWARVCSDGDGHKEAPLG